jgi:hypothetical protein
VRGNHTQRRRDRTRRLRRVRQKGSLHRSSPRLG